MKNKRVKQMMVDIERQHTCPTENISWCSGVVIYTGGNFLWPNHKLTVRVFKNEKSSS